MTRYKKNVKSETSKEIFLMIESLKEVEEELFHKDQAQLFQKEENVLKPSQLQALICLEPQDCQNPVKERLLKMF
jgi:hypothetical protein